MSSRRQFIATAGLCFASTSIAHAAGQDGKQEGSAEKTSDSEQKKPAGKPQPLDSKLVNRFVGASHGSLKVVKELLAQEPKLVHASWDWVAGDFETGLGAASHVGSRDVANLLLDKGARIDAFAMAMLGNDKLLAAIIEAYPATMSVPGPHGIPLISHAIFGREAADGVLEMLIAKQVDLAQTSNGGQTALMAAAMVGRPEILETLVAAGADPKLVDKSGKTALDHARARKHEAAIKYLSQVAGGKA